jgi:hypothetical protein
MLHREIVMSTAQLKQLVDEATPSARQFLGAYLRHLARRDDPLRRRRLDALQAEFGQEGKRFTMAEARKRHRKLQATGL